MHTFEVYVKNERKMCYRAARTGRAMTRCIHMSQDAFPIQLHSGHRTRVWDRYLQTAFDGFAEHEIMEFILFQVIPRVDVNALAHRLIDRFGSLAGVLDAPLAELVTVDGVGERTAKYLHTLPDISRAYAMSKTKNTDVMDSLEKVEAYLRALYTGEVSEKMYLLVLDNAHRLIQCRFIAEGTVNQVNVNMRRIVEFALRDGAAALILAHNHPGGLAIPSREDISMTSTLEEILHLVGIPLIDHVVVSDHSCAGIRGRLPSTSAL